MTVLTEILTGAPSLLNTTCTRQDGLNQVDMGANHCKDRFMMLKREWWDTFLQKEEDKLIVWESMTDQDDSCLIIRDSSIEQIESILNRNFNALCDWFVENKLSIHFGEDKTKSILFSHKKCKNLEKLDIRRGDIKIKQHSKVKYLGCLLDENLSGESMATKMLGKINGKL